MKSIFFENIRHFTISSIFVKAQFKRSLKPKLTLSGDWMNAAGFSIGDKVTVKISDNQLIIDKDDSNSSTND
ncbi:SymE family type I addiction module toxin [Flavobacterium rhizosphaerae]|uniref:SymE family type I addiction module toxin n=1 Tax=Flavobacterium rhizosphaerae TaxID=3163298 RepID=A0ABW8Z020_9FLAO